MQPSLAMSDTKSPSSVLDELKNSAGFFDPYPEQIINARKFEKILNELDCLIPIKVSVVGNTTTDQICSLLRFWLGLNGFCADIRQGPFGTLEQSVFDPKSDIYSNDPDIVWIFTSHRDFLYEAVECDSEAEYNDRVESVIERFETLWANVHQNCAAQIIQNNVDLPFERVMGNFDGSSRFGRLTFLRDLNAELSRRTTSGISILDLDHISNIFGKANWCEERYWHHAKISFSLDAHGYVAHAVARLIAAVKGRSRKCLVLDLDNTLWGGVIGDDGLDGIELGDGPAGEAFVSFQKYLKALSKRGVVLAVCSKNELENAEEVFLKHPAMVLRKDDIAVFVANWQNKADNIRVIAERLNLGLDALVFVDDNPAERDLVRQELPMVAVPELPENPELYLRTLDQCKYFEIANFSREDQLRTDMYRNNAQREEERLVHTDLDNFLSGLNMSGSIGQITDKNLSRVSQLINKSNQFHLTTTRYPEAKINSMLESDEFICRSVRLKDKFGDNGLISVFILRRENESEMKIDTWVMSCRVLSRGVEDFICNEMISLTKSSGCKKLVGKYFATPKNKLVESLYDRLGFDLVSKSGQDSTWSIDPEQSNDQRENHIKKVSETEYDQF